MPEWLRLLKPLAKRNVSVTPDTPSFYDPDSLYDTIDLLHNLHRDSKYLEPSSGFAMYMKRTPVGSLKQKQGGKIPNWAKRHIQ